ncbi:MAG: vWA domain-containing protein [Thermoguttaceae bacterium]
MTFGHPLWLLWLAVPVVFAVWEATRRRPGIAMPFDYGQEPSGRGLERLLRVAGLLPALLLAVAIVIYCRPLRLAAPKQQRQMTNIEFLLDVSGSMTSRFGEGSRYDASMAALAEFTARRKGDAFGLTIFGNEVLRWTPLTKDLAALKNATPFLRPEILPPHFGGTEIGKALRFCRESLPERGEGDRAIILLSDGCSADLGPDVSRQIGGELADNRIVLYAIHIGDDAVPNDLYELCRPTGGQVFVAATPATMAAVFDHIDHMQPAKLKPGAPQPVDYFRPFALVGLIGLGFYQLSLFGLRYTPW